ncbi:MULTISPECIES: BrnT family toxin [unclassified Mesorhizobium]|uniref:BrnT family toxin n=2 Tax=unclassified Mesorhizobium TaxID=325217 RepID=UPI0011283098|nr:MULTISPECIES: BrnT family toxin [unclassified Mesorhizobium]MCA0027057.1 BrnT family toxin [Mesorhizobium sp. B263B1A]TPJ95836.1 BrnT family toxin [Mesorhizobium sp. B2-5-12]TPK20718.1 BrnT family toxin [Mesorhizobium sp. B2-5-6]TPN41332.1 BrnT family toxin [Mesorhizobium sp. B1-1-6]
MRFEWDAERARRKLAKLGIGFDLAQKVFDDPLYLIVPDRFEDGEQRWHAIGTIDAVVVMLVVHTYPDREDEERVRIVGARKATAHERRRYEQEGPWSGAAQSARQAGWFA